MRMYEELIRYEVIVLCQRTLTLYNRACDKMTMLTKSRRRTCSHDGIIIENLSIKDSNSPRMQPCIHEEKSVFLSTHCPGITMKNVLKNIAT